MEAGRPLYPLEIGGAALSFLCQDARRQPLTLSWEQNFSYHWSRVWIERRQRSAHFNKFSTLHFFVLIKMARPYSFASPPRHFAKVQYTRTSTIDRFSIASPMTRRKRTPLTRGGNHNIPTFMARRQRVARSTSESLGILWMTIEVGRV